MRLIGIILGLLIGAAAQAVPIPNNYCSFSGQVASLNPSTQMAYANKKFTFQITSIELPGGSSTLPIGPSTQVCQTDAQGVFIPDCQIQQGAHVNLQVGNGPPLPLVIPFSTTCDLSAIMLAQTDPPNVVSGVATQGPLFAGTTVTNPPLGTIGTSTINSPAAYSQTQAGTATVDVGTNGNNQQVILAGGSVTVALSNFTSGANFSIDTTEDAAGGRSPVFTVPAGWSLMWSGNGTVQPPMPATTANTHVIWYFQAVSPTVLVGSLQAGGTGGFPLSATANANNWSIINANGLTLSPLTAPALTCVATCSGVCGTTYTYESTAVGDNSTQSASSSVVTCTNAAGLSATNYNTLTWVQPSVAHGGTDIYGRVAGSLGLLGNNSSGSLVDNGSVVPGAAPPLYGTAGLITSAGIMGAPSMAFGFVTANAMANGQYIPFAGSAAASDATEAIMQMPAPSAGVIKAMYCNASVGSPGAATWTFTLRKNGSSTAMTCNFTAADTTCHDTNAADAVTFVAGDLLDALFASTGGTTGGGCSYRVLN